MALATAVLSDVQRETLVAVCDTFVPSVSDPSADPVMQAFLARSAGDLAVAEQIEGLMAQAMTDDQVQGFAELLDALAEQSFAELPLAGADAGPARRGGVLARGAAGRDRPAQLDLPVLLRLRRRARTEPQLGGARLPRADLGSALPGAGAEDDHGHGSRGPAGDA